MAHTADGHPVVIGGTYWSNDLERVTVTRELFTENGSVWFATTGGMADGSRLATRHPFTGERAS